MADTRLEGRISGFVSHKYYMQDRPSQKVSQRRTNESRKRRNFPFSMSAKLRPFFSRLFGLDKRRIRRMSLGNDWSYEGANGPDNWHKNFPIAAGDYQSPVDIQTRNIIYDPALADINFIGYHTSPGNSYQLRNTGCAVKIPSNGRQLYCRRSWQCARKLFGRQPSNTTTIWVEKYTSIDLQGNLSINGADFKNSFEAFQLQFHWGSKNEQGSEHLIDSKAFPMEFHIVHKNEKYSEEDTLLKTDGLVILAVMVEIGENDNEGMRILTEHLSKVRCKDQEVSIPSFPLSTLLPLDTEKYYHYPGSLTAPPCNECVTWIVFHKTIKVTQSLLEEWRSLMTKQESTGADVPLADNFRKTQSLKRRIITASLKLQDGLMPYTPSDESSTEITV